MCSSLCTLYVVHVACKVPDSLNRTKARAAGPLYGDPTRVPYMVLQIFSMWGLLLLVVYELVSLTLVALAVIHDTLFVPFALFE